MRSRIRLCRFFSVGARRIADGCQVASTGGSCVNPVKCEACGFMFYNPRIEKVELGMAMLRLHGAKPRLLGCFQELRISRDENPALRFPQRPCECSRELKGIRRR